MTTCRTHPPRFGGLRSTVWTPCRVVESLALVSCVVDSGPVMVIWATERVPADTALHGGSVALAHGRTVHADAVILATEYGTDLEELADGLGVLDTHDCRSTAQAERRPRAARAGYNSWIRHRGPGCTGESCIRGQGSWGAGQFGERDVGVVVAGGCFIDCVRVRSQTEV